MADNLRQLTQQVDFAVPINAGVASVKTVNHNPLEKDIISKVGKYTGFPFTATGGYHNGNPQKGYFYWNNNVSNSTNPYTITFSSYTADTNYIGNLLNKFRIDDFLHYKDFAGRSCFVKILEVDVRIDGFGNLYCDLLVQGNNLDNSFVLGNTEFATCMIDIIHNIVDQVDVTGFLTDVDYDNTNHVATFKRYNMPDYIIDFPIEFLISNIDIVGNDLVITFEDGTTKVVPLNTLLVGVVKEVNGVTPDSLGRVYLSITDIPGLQSALNGKADLVHTHTISQIGNLQNVLDGKADVRLSNVVSNLTPAEQTAIKSKLGISDTDTVTRIGTNASNLNSGDFIFEGVGQTTVDLVGNKIYIETNIDLSPFAIKDGSNATGILNDAIVKRHDAVTLGPNSTGLNLSGQVLQFANGYQMPTANEVADWNSLVANIGNYALRNGSNIINPNTWRTNLDVYSTVQVNNLLSGKQDNLTASNGIQLVSNNISLIYGTTANTVAQGNDSRFHNPVTLGTGNGLSLANQVLSLALAGALSTGALSSTDWNNFNNKVSANNGNITYVGTGNITGGGTSSANQSVNTNYSFDLTAQTKTDIGLGVSAYNSLGNYQPLLSNGLHTILNGNKIDVAFDVNTPVRDKNNAERLIFGNTASTDVVIKGAVTNGDFRVEDSTGNLLFRMNGTNKVPYFPQLPAPQTGDNYLAVFDSGNGLWKQSTRISDLVTTSVLNAGLATKANVNGNNLTNIPQWLTSLGVYSTTQVDGFLAGKVNNLNTVQSLAFDSGLATGDFYAIHTNGTYVPLARLDYVNNQISGIVGSLSNKANTDASNLVNTVQWRNVLSLYSIAEVDSLLANKANTSGYYSGLHVGTADNAGLWSGQAYIGNNNPAPTDFMTYQGNGWGYNTIPQVQALLGITTALNLNLQQVATNGNSTNQSLTIGESISTIGGNGSGIYIAPNQGGGASITYNSNGNLDISPRIGYNIDFKSGTILTASHGTSADWYNAFLATQNLGNYVNKAGDTMSGTLILNSLNAKLIFKSNSTVGNNFYSYQNNAGILTHNIGLTGNNNNYDFYAVNSTNWLFYSSSNEILRIGDNIVRSSVNIETPNATASNHAVAFGQLSNYVDVTTQNQIINANKIFLAQGNTPYSKGIELRGDGSTLYPGLGFHQPGVLALMLEMQNDGLLYWNNEILASRNWVANNFASQSQLGNYALIDGSNLTNIAGWQTTLNTAEWGLYEVGLTNAPFYALTYDASVAKWKPTDNTTFKTWLDLSAYALVSQIPTVNNGLLTFGVSADFSTGGFIFSANQGTNSTSNLALSTSIKNDIASGVLAFNSLGNYMPINRTITINGVTQNINNNPVFTVSAIVPPITVEAQPPIPSGNIAINMNKTRVSVMAGGSYKINDGNFEGDELVIVPCGNSFDISIDMRYMDYCGDIYNNLGFDASRPRYFWWSSNDNCWIDVTT